MEFLLVFLILVFVAISIFLGLYLGTDTFNSQELNSAPSLISVPAPRIAPSTVTGNTTTSPTPIMPSVPIPAAVTPTVSTSTTAITGQAPAGYAVSCSGPPGVPGGIYQYDGNKTIKHYPSPQIASSWDANWGSGAGRVINCTGFTVGIPLEAKPTPVSTSTISTTAISGQAPAGYAVSCSGSPGVTGAIYQYDGNTTIKHYPNPQIASSWDVNWSSGAGRVINCTGFTIGTPLEAKPASSDNYVCNKNNKCLSVEGDNGNNGSNILQNDKTDNSGQRWTLSADGHLCNKHSKCLGIAENSTENGKRAIQWDKINENGQLWSLSSDGHLCNKNGKCLGSSQNSSDINASIIQWDRTTENGQLWSFS